MFLDCVLDARALVDSIQALCYSKEVFMHFLKNRYRDLPKVWLSLADDSPPQA